MKTDITALRYPEFESPGLTAARTELWEAVAELPPNVRNRVLQAAGDLAAHLTINIALRCRLAEVATNSKVQ